MTNHTDELRNPGIRVALDRKGVPVARRTAGPISQHWQRYLSMHREEIVDELHSELIELIWECSDSGVTLEVDDGILCISGLEQANGEDHARIDALAEGLIWLLSPMEEDDDD